MASDASVPAETSDRDWWLRTLALLQSPSSTFRALRDDRRESADARQEPVLALVWLAGIAGVLAFGSTTATLLDPSVSEVFFRPTQLDGLEAAVYIFLAGGLYGLASFWLGGLVLHIGSRAAGGLASYRQARHTLAFAAVPLILILPLWPVRLAVYGDAVFRTGGADEVGAARWVFDAIEFALLGWSAVLLVLGLSALHAWPVVRAIGALVLAVMALVVVALVFLIL